MVELEAPVLLETTHAFFWGLPQMPRHQGLFVHGTIRNMQEGCMAGLLYPEAEESLKGKQLLPFPSPHSCLLSLTQLMEGQGAEQSQVLE